MATPMVDLTADEHSTADSLPDYEDCFWVPCYLRREKKNAESDRERASATLDELAEEYEELQRKKRELHDAEMALNDQIEHFIFQVKKADATIHLVRNAIQKLTPPPPPSGPRSRPRSPDCPPV